MMERITQRHESVNSPRLFLIIGLAIAVGIAAAVLAPDAERVAHVVEYSGFAIMVLCSLAVIGLTTRVVLSKHVDKATRRSSILHIIGSTIGIAEAVILLVAPENTLAIVVLGVLLATSVALSARSIRHSKKEIARLTEEANRRSPKPIMR